MKKSLASPASNWPADLLRLISFAAILSCLSLYLACGGGSSASAPPGTPSITSVSVVGPAYTQTGQCQVFTATVHGNGTFNTSVTWSVNGAAGGSAADGTISGNGNYCAPNQIPSTNPVSISAVASGDTTKSGNTTSQVIGIQVLPSQATLYLTGTQQFTATVTGATTNSVIWMVNGVAGGNSAVGTISATGLYSAPSQATNTAISVQAASVLSSSIVSLASISLIPSIALPALSTISPQPATAGDSITITGTNLNGLVTGVFTNASNGTISTVPVSGAGTSVLLIVPQGSVTGPFYVVAQQPGLTAVQSNTLQFQRLARLRIHAPTNDVAAGESVTFSYALLGDSTPQSVTF